MKNPCNIKPHLYWHLSVNKKQSGATDEKVVYLWAVNTVNYTLPKWSEICTAPSKAAKWLTGSPLFDGALGDTMEKIISACHLIGAYDAAIKYYRSRHFLCWAKSNKNCRAHCTGLSHRNNRRKMEPFWSMRLRYPSSLACDSLVFRLVYFFLFLQISLNDLNGNMWILLGNRWLTVHKNNNTF